MNISMAETKQHAPVVTVMDEQSAYGRYGTRSENFVSPERHTFERKKQSLATTDCIDLTAYDDVKDERESSLMSSTATELKIDERSSSNCENEAAVAVNNIKDLLDLGDNDDMMTIEPMINLSRSDNIAAMRTAKRNHPNNHNEATNRKQHTSDNQLWMIDEPPRPENLHQSKSEYHMAKDRLISARRLQNKSLRKATNEFPDIIHLTEKHEKLILKSSEYLSRSNDALIEIIDIEHDLVASPPTSPTSMGGNRLFIDTSDMDRILDDDTPHSPRDYEGNDLVSAFGYEFKKRDFDERSDIIFIDDDILTDKQRSGDKVVTSIAGQNVAARYEAIRNSVAGQMSKMERTRVHPLATPFLTLREERRVVKQRDLSPSKIHFIRDQVKSLRQKQHHLDDVQSEQLGQAVFPIDETDDASDNESENNSERVELYPQETTVRSPSRASAIEGLIASDDRQEDPPSFDDDDASIRVPLRAEAEYRKKSKVAVAVTLPTSMLENYDDQGDHWKAGTDFLAITKNMSSKPYSTDLMNDLLPTPSSKATSDKIEKLSECKTNQSNQPESGIQPSDSIDGAFQSVRDTSDPIAQESAIVSKESAALVTANELCVGFCTNNGDTISIPDNGNAITADPRELQNLSPIQSTISGTVDIVTATDQKEAQLLQDKLTVTEEQSPKSKSNVDTQTKSKSKEGHNNKRINDLALSDDESSESYPSDVEVNGENTINYMNHAKITSRSASEKYTNTVDTKTQSSKSVASTANESNVKRNIGASVSDNASFVSDNSGTRASLCDSENSDSDEETNIYYDACFARQIFDDTCAWLERDEGSFCFRPSLLKKVKRRNVGSLKKHYGRSPLVLRVPRNPIMTRSSYHHSRRKAKERPIIRSKKKGHGDSMPNPETQLTMLRFRQHQTLSNTNAESDVLPVASTNNKHNTIETFVQEQEEIEDLVTPNTTNFSNGVDVAIQEESRTQTREYSVAERSSGVFEADSKNLAIFEVKSADEYTSRHFSAYQQLLQSRSVSPMFVSKQDHKLKEKVSEQVVRRERINELDPSDVLAELCSKIARSRSREPNTFLDNKNVEDELQTEPIDCTGSTKPSLFPTYQSMDSPKSNTYNEHAESYSRRDGLANHEPSALSNDKHVDTDELEAEHIDCTGDTSGLLFSSYQSVDSPKSQTTYELGEAELSARTKSRREGLAKLRHPKSPIRHELIQIEQIESEMESTTDSSILNEEQRLAALDMAEKLRRRAVTLRRRRKLRERRRDSHDAFGM